MTAARIIRGHIGIGPGVAGPALVGADYFSARYDLDRIRGTVARPGHALFGQSYVGKVLVLKGAKGGVATAWMLHEMAARQMAPLALLLNTANPIMAQGAAFAGVAFMDRFERDVTEIIQNGAWVEVEPAEGLVRVRPAETDRSVKSAR